MIGVKTNTEEGYFLAGRFMTWLPVSACLYIVISNILVVINIITIIIIAVVTCRKNLLLLLELIGMSMITAKRSL